MHSLVVATVTVNASVGRVLPGMYRCIAYRRNNQCVTIVINGQRYTSLGDLLQLEGTLGHSDISYMVFLRPEEAGTLYGSESTNGVLVIVRKGEH